MGLLTCGGYDVLSGKITMPLVGAWVADLVVDTATALGGRVDVIADGGVSLSGTVASSGVSVDACHVRVVGGAGGLRTIVSGAYASALLRDPLGAVLRAAGESQSKTIDQGILGAQVRRWTLSGATAARALADLAEFAGDDVSWRVLEDGKVWLGRETWPASTLPDSDYEASQDPGIGLHVIAVATPSLVPGVALDGVGKVRGVEHWIGHDVRTHLWT